MAQTQQGNRGNTNASGSGSGQDRNNDNRGRGNFGNPEQHAEAGRQSSGNRGNPEQHAEAGRQSSGNRGGQQGGSGGQQSGSSREKMESRFHNRTIEQMRDLLQEMQSDLSFHETSAEEIRMALQEVKGEIDQIGEIAQQSEGSSQQGKQSSGQKQGAEEEDEERGRGRPVGSGSGTGLILDILQDGPKNRRDLLEEAKKRGIKSPYSSFYSLEKSGKVKRDRQDNVTLVS